MLGSRVTVKSGVQLWDGVRVEDDVFIGPNATFTNDSFPRSKHRLDKPGRILLCAGCSVGANATILPSVKIGMGAMIGAGAVVTHDVPPYAVVTGNPARISAYANASRPSITSSSEATTDRAPLSIGVAGVRLLHLPEIEDLRGRLIFGEIGDQLPFVPKRYFLVTDVPSKEVRGEHAHRQLEQLLICVKGTLSVVVDDGTKRAEILLASPRDALYLPPMVWGTQYKYSADAALLVLASAKYSADDYIRDYDEFTRIVRRSLT